MKKRYILLSLTVSAHILACDFISQTELLKALLQSEEAQLAHKEKSLITGKEQNNLRRRILAIGSLIAAVSSLYRKHDLRAESYNELQFGEVDRYMKPIVAHALGLVMMGIGAYMPYKNTENIQTDIDHSKTRIEKLKAILATLQTKSPSSPETAHKLQEGQKRLAPQ